VNLERKNASLEVSSRDVRLELERERGQKVALDGEEVEGIALSEDLLNLDLEGSKVSEDKHGKELEDLEGSKVRLELMKEREAVELKELESKLRKLQDKEKRSGLRVSDLELKLAEMTGERDNLAAKRAEEATMKKKQMQILAGAEPPTPRGGGRERAGTAYKMSKINAAAEVEVEKVKSVVASVSEDKHGKELEDALRGMEAVAERWKGLCGELEEENGEMSDEVLRLEGDMATMDEEKEAVGLRVSDLELKLAEMTQKLTVALNAAIHEVDTGVESGCFDTGKAALTDTCTALRSSLEIQVANADASKASCEDLERRCEDLERIIRQLRSELSTLSAQQKRGPHNPEKAPMTPRGTPKKSRTPMGATSLRHAFFEVAMASSQNGNANGLSLTPPSTP